MSRLLPHINRPAGERTIWKNRARIETRRQRLIDLVETHTVEQAAEALNVSVHTIRADERAIGARCVRIFLGPEALAQSREQRHRALELLAPHHTIDECAALLRVSDHTIRVDELTLGIQCRRLSERGSRSRRQKPLPALQEAIRTQALLRATWHSPGPLAAD